MRIFLGMTHLLSTSEILSSIIDAAHHGSATIRRLSNEATRSSNNVTYKEEGDTRSAMTLADTTAQNVIVSSLLSQYPELCIVGEEDESVQVDKSRSKELKQNLNLSFEFGAGEHLPLPSDLDMKHVVFYVDPLDGTREFVEGRFDNVQCLIGLCYRGRPLLGAIGLPFPQSDQVEVVYGLIGRGIGKVQLDSDCGMLCTAPLLAVKKFSGKNDGVSVSSGDSSNALLGDVIKSAEDVLGSDLNRQIVGATGNKILRVVYGESTFSIMHDKTSLWDTAAPTALLHAVGGLVTDVFGEPLVYNAATEKGNRLGVIASAFGANKLHSNLAKKNRGDSKILSILKRFNPTDLNESSCVDIVRDQDGYPLPAKYFSEKLDNNEIECYTCPEKDAVRGLMSNGCRIYFQPSGTSAFFKRIVFSNLDHALSKLKTAPHKLDRDVKSYRVESAFLASKACQQIIETGLRIPKCFDAILELNDENPIESSFLILLEDFSSSDGWSQRWLLRDEEECKAALVALAKMHAFFWTGSKFWDQDAAITEELVAGVWESACYVQPKLQTHNQCQEVAAGWEANREKCRRELDNSSFWNNLGSRLQSIAEVNGKVAHPFATDSVTSKKFDRLKTFIHGDPKQANLFFRRGKNNNVEVGLIDFQWSGFGLAASDIAHHITAAVHSDRLVNDGEENLLKHYYDTLQSYLLEFGAFRDKDAVESIYSYEIFLEQYETGVMDMCRLVIPYAWSRFEAVHEEKDHARTMNKNSYNKSLSNVVWLMNRCDRILSKRGVN